MFSEYLNCAFIALSPYVVWVNMCGRHRGTRTVFELLAIAGATTIVSKICCDGFLIVVFWFDKEKVLCLIWLHDLNAITVKAVFA